MRTIFTIDGKPLTCNDKYIKDAFMIVREPDVKSMCVNIRLIDKLTHILLTWEYEKFTQLADLPVDCQRHEDVLEDIASIEHSLGYLTVLWDMVEQGFTTEIKYRWLAD